ESEDEESFRQRRTAAREELTSDLLAALRAILDERKAEDDPSGPPAPGLVAVGPSVIVPGALMGVDGSTWRIRLTPACVRAAESGRTSFCDSFDTVPRKERYVVIETHGEGRVLARPPRWSREGGNLMIDVHVEPLGPRADATKIGSDLAMDMEKV